MAKAKSVPGVAIAIFEGGKVSYITCGSRGADNGRPVTTETVFEGASLSKPLFAFALMDLVEHHRLDLDAPLSTYLPAGAEHESDPFHRTGIREPVSHKLLQEVTARTILHHTTGLPNWMEGQPLALTGPPEGWQYSGEGFVLLQKAVESITGKPLDQWMQQELFGPLAMRHSSFRWESRFGFNEAIGHDENGKPVPADHYPYPLASTTLYTTIVDYVVFLKQAFSSQRSREFFARHKVAVNPEHDLFWGSGVGIEETAQEEIVLHGGSSPGFRDYFWYDPDLQRGFLFLSNGENGYALVAPFVQMILPRHHPALTAPELHLPH